MSATAMIGVTIPMIRIGKIAAARTAGEFERKATTGSREEHALAQPDHPEQNEAQAHARPAPLLRLVRVAAARAIGR